MRSAAAVALMPLLIFSAYTAAVSSDSPCFYNGLHNPKYCQFPLRHRTMVPWASHTQTASRSVQPFM